MLLEAVNYLAILVAALANMAVGFVWYGPLFGTQWMSLMGINKEKVDSQKAKGETLKSYGIAFIGSVLMAYVLSYFIILAVSYFNTKGVQTGLMAGFWVWLGFVVPVTLSTVIWEGKTWNLWVLNNGYYLISLLLMGSILAVWI